MTFRQIVLRSHLVLGCVAAPFLFVAGISGAIVVFENPYADHVANARLAHVTPGSALLSLDAIHDSVRHTFPGANVVQVSFPLEGRNTYAVGLAIPSDSNGTVVYVDPWRGTILGNDETARSPLRWAHDLHTRLMFGQPGRLVMAWVAVSLVFLSLTGLWLWWPGRVLRVRRRSGTERTYFELHNMLGGLSWIFMLVFGLTGMIVHWEDGAQKLLFAVTGGTKPPPPPRPTDACDARPMASLDLIKEHIDAAAPGAYATMIQFGEKASDPVMARMRYPEDKTPAGRTIVVAERCTGKVLYASSTRAAPFAWRWTRMWNRSVHTGDVFGWPTRIFAALLSLLLPVMTLTGPAIWWMRRTRRANR